MESAEPRVAKEHSLEGYIAPWGVINQTGPGPGKWEAEIMGSHNKKELCVIYFLVNMLI